MNTKIKSVLAAASMLALSALTANAQLILSGTFKGGFSSYTDAGGTTPVAVVPSSSAYFNFGSQPVGDLAFTSVQFAGGSFANTAIPSSPDFSVVYIGGIAGSPPIDFKIYNKDDNNLLAATFDLYLDYTSNQVGPGSSGLVKLTTITWTWTGPSALQTFVSTLSPIPTFVVGDYTVLTDISGTFRFSVADGQTGTNTDGALFSTAVPEPSTYALFGVVALMGVVAVRRFRSSKKVA